MATSKDRQEEFRRVAEFNRAICGVDVEEISPTEIKRLFPLCDTEDVLSGFYVQDDGRVNPVDATRAFAKGVKLGGGRIAEGVRVVGVETTSSQGPSGLSHRNTGRRAVSGVTVSDKNGELKTIRCEYVVNCAGMWARQLGELSGVNIPLQAAEHYYLITDEIDIVKNEGKNWPVIEDPSSYTYIRKEGPGLMVGLFESAAAAWNVERIPADFSFGEIEPDWDRMGPFVEKAMSRVPKSLESGVSKFFCGPESFTPDLAPILGPAPELDNYFVAAGLNSVGILTGGGVGRLMSSWICEGEPDVDVSGLHIDRLQNFQNTPQYRKDRVVESLGMVYKPHYPTHIMQTARNVKLSPLHARLKQRGACFRDVSGWEGADWFLPKEYLLAGGPRRMDEDPPTPHPLCWGRHHWFPYWEAEHRACREGVGLLDMSFMSKFRVQGRDAGKYLNRLCTADVVEQPGITYTQWLTPNGKMEGDVTVAKISTDDYLVVVTDTCHRAGARWLERWIGENDHVFVTDVSGMFAQINVQGPNSRRLMQEVG